MFFVWALTGVLNAAGVLEPGTGQLWHWFGQHVLLTILMILFLG